MRRDERREEKRGEGRKKRRGEERGKGSRGEEWNGEERWGRGDKRIGIGRRGEEKNGEKRHLRSDFLFAATVWLHNMQIILREDRRIFSARCCSSLEQGEREVGERGQEGGRDGV